MPPNVPVEILPYKSVKYELSFRNAIVYRNDRILVLAGKTLITDWNCIWAKVQRLGGSGHRWCPGMNKQLKQFIDTCEVCNAFQTKNQQTLVKSWVWYFWVEHYTVLVDYYADVIALPQG